MADSYTPVLNMVKPEIDQSAETWGQKLNADLDLLDAFAGNVNAQIASAPASITAAITAALPRGLIVAWWGQPANVPAGWLLCDGTNGTPNLTDRFILGTNGSRSIGEAAGSFSQSGATDQQGAHAHGGSTQGYALTVNEMAYHRHGGWTDAQGDHVHQYNMAQWGNGNWVQGASGTQINIVGTTTGLTNTGPHTHNVGIDFQGGGQPHYHALYTDGWHQHNYTYNIVPPYMALCYIMRA